jgi:hypothetical protein
MASLVIARHILASCAKDSPLVTQNRPLASLFPSAKGLAAKTRKRIGGLAKPACLGFHNIGGL